MLRSMIREMEAAGLSKWEMVGEVLGAFCLFLIPIMFLFIGHAFGLK